MSGVKVVENKHNILDDLDMCGFKEIRFNELKVGNEIIFTYRNGLVVGELIVRHAKVVRVNGYVVVHTSRSVDTDVMLQPGNLTRDERYYRRVSVAPVLA